MLMLCHLLVLLLPCLQDAPLKRTPLPEEATGDPRGSALFADLERAQNLLDAAVEAHGGARWVTGATSFRITATGQLDFQAHLARPWASHAFELVLSTEVAGPEQITLNILQRTRGGSQTWMRVYGSESGLSLEVGAFESEWIHDEALAYQRAEDLQHLPWFHLARALEQAGTLTLLPGTPNTDRILVRLKDGASWALDFGQNDHLLKRTESLAHWPGKGDRLQWIDFREYAPTSGIPVPAEVRMHLEGATVQEDYRLQLSGLDLTTRDGIEGLIPAAQRTAFGDLTRLQPQVHTDLLTTHDLGNGVFSLDLPSESARSILVEFADYCVVIESGGTSENGAAVLDTAQALWPDKPVRYLAMSHHHRISASGLRPYVQRGVTLLATPGNVAYLTDLATRPYRLAPDAQARSPREPVIQVVDGVLILQDATQRLELHVFDSSTHTDEYVLSYVPGLKWGSIGDLLYLGDNPTKRKANSRGLALFDLIQKLDLEVETLTQTWPLEPAYERIAWSMLAAQVTNTRQ